MENQEILNSMIKARGDLEITITGADGKIKSKHWYKNTVVNIGKDYIANRLIGGTGNTGPVSAAFTQADTIPYTPTASTTGAATVGSIAVSNGAITSIAINNGPASGNGNGRYTSIPTVIIRGGNGPQVAGGAVGVDARAIPIMIPDPNNPGYYRVSGISIVSGGSGYTNGTTSTYTQAANGTDYTSTAPSGNTISVKLVGGFAKRSVSYMAIGQTNDAALVPAAAAVTDTTLINELYRNQLTFVQYPNTAAATTDQKRSILFTARFGAHDPLNSRLTGPSSTCTIREAGIFNAPALGAAANDSVTDTVITPTGVTVYGGDMLCRTTFGAIVKEKDDTVDIRWTVTIQ
jgi:hypothetical protein